MRKINGILPINKPSGISSYDVIRMIKKSLGFDSKSQKIGHGGTLDKSASGVLPVLLGEASKAFDYLLQSEKVYRAVIQLGANTDTDDAEGLRINTFDTKIGRSDLEAVLPEFTGSIMQVPPVYSSLHINGTRSYELARRNINVENSAREVEINDISLDSFDSDKFQASLTVKCSSGTYIRSLARDIGERLNCGGYILELTRLSSSGIMLKDCIKPDEVTGLNIEKLLIPLNCVLSMPALTFLPQKTIVTNGRNLMEEFFGEKAEKDGLYKIVQEGNVLAIVQKNGGKFHYLRVFNE